MAIKTNSQKIYVYNTDIFDQINYIFKTKQSTHIIIPNVCTQLNKITSGFSRELYKRYPSAEINTSIGIATKKMCTNVVVQENKTTKGKIIIANMYCQSNQPIGKRSLHYGRMVYCMYEIKSLINSLKNDFPDFTTEIHSPKLGTGIAGGNWAFIEELILDIWGSSNVFIYNHLRKN